MQDQGSPRRNHMHFPSFANFPPSSSFLTAPGSSMPAFVPPLPTLRSDPSTNLLQSPWQSSVLPPHVLPPSVPGSPRTTRSILLQQSATFLHMASNSPAFGHAGAFPTVNERGEWSSPQSFVLNSNPYPLAGISMLGQYRPIQPLQRPLCNARGVVSGVTSPQRRAIQYSGHPINSHAYHQVSALSLPSYEPQPVLRAPATQSITFVHEKIKTENQKRGKREERQEQAIRSTIKAGGACVFCKGTKKKCGTEKPCTSCARANPPRPCIRDASCLCLPSTTRPNNKPRISDKNFSEARAILEQLKPGMSIQKHADQHGIYVDWASLDDTPFQNSWWGKFDQLDLNEMDANVRESLIRLALNRVSTPQIDQAGYADPLYRDACMMFKLFSAIETLSRSKLSVQPVAVEIARMIIFFLLTVYAMEMSKISVRFASHLYGAIRDKRQDDDPVRCAIKIYSRVIEGIVSFQRLHSFMSGLFNHIQSRLDHVQADIHKLLLMYPCEEDTIIPSPSGLNHFKIAIGFAINEQGILPTAFSRHEMSHNQLPCDVDELLHRDFDTRINLEPSIPAETINPQLILLSHPTTPEDLAFDSRTLSSPPSTTNDDSFDNVFSDPQEGTRWTNTTLSQTPHGLLLDQTESSSSGANFDGNDRSEVLLSTGTHFTDSYMGTFFDEI